MLYTLRAELMHCGRVNTLKGKVMEVLKVGSYWLEQSFDISLPIVYHLRK